MEMTLRAINSLITSTPIVFVGILVPPHYDTSDLYSRLVDPSRVIFKEFRAHFDKWNPTQHKLDIVQFATEFSIVFWMDSDTFVYKDLTPLLMDFRLSNAKFAFVSDHVCTNPEFLGNWKNKNSPLIPQACFMGFRRDYMHSFFSLWEEVWRSWIEPAPFHNYPDPVPSFVGSAFCIEQYALGMAIEKFGLSKEDIFELRRVCIPLGGLLAQTNFLKSLLPSEPDYTSPTFLSPTQPARTKKQKRHTKSHSQDNNNFMETFENFSMNFGSNDNKDFYSNNNNTNNNNSSSGFGTPTLVAGLDQTFLEHISMASSWRSSDSAHVNSSYGSSYGSSASSMLGAFWIDDIEGYVLHFYSLNYELIFAWFTNHKNIIMSKTEEYWTPRGMPHLSL